MRTFIAFLAILVLAGHADAQQQNCAQRTEIVGRLDRKYHETHLGLGLRHDGSVVEVFRSVETGTWTIIISNPDGTSCIADAGQMWEDVDPEEATKPGVDS